MTAHILTEADCDALRFAMQDRAIETTGTPASATWQEAVKLLDQVRSDSFLHRAAAKADLTHIFPEKRVAIGLRYSR